jgi:hypothetical protein
LWRLIGRRKFGPAICTFATNSLTPMAMAQITSPSRLDLLVAGKVQQIVYRRTQA